MADKDTWVITIEIGKGDNIAATKAVLAQIDGMLRGHGFEFERLSSESRRAGSYRRARKVKP